MQRCRTIIFEMSRLVFILCIPSILQYILSTKQSFVRFIRLMTTVDAYFRLYIGFTDIWFNFRKDDKSTQCPFDQAFERFQQHLQEQIIENVWDRHKELEAVMNAFYHSILKGSKTRRWQCLQWILEIDEGRLMKEMVIDRFRVMYQYADEIDALEVDVHHFSIFVSLLVFRFKTRLMSLVSWKRLMCSSPETCRYWSSVMNVFWYSRDNKMLKELKKQMSGFVNEVVGHQERIYCGNVACEINYYKHKYGMRAFTHWNELKRANWYKCKACKVVYYCSRRCQKLDWNNGSHKEICKQFCK